MRSRFERGGKAKAQSPPDARRVSCADGSTGTERGFNAGRYASRMMRFRRRIRSADSTFARDRMGRAVPREYTKRETGRLRNGICQTKGRAKPYQRIAGGGAARGGRFFRERRQRHSADGRQRLSDKGRGFPKTAATVRAMVWAYRFRIAVRASAGAGKAVSFGGGRCPGNGVRGS